MPTTTPFTLSIPNYHIYYHLTSRHISYPGVSNHIAHLGTNCHISHPDPTLIIPFLALASTSTSLALASATDKDISLSHITRTRVLRYIVVPYYLGVAAGASGDLIFVCLHGDPPPTLLQLSSIHKSSHFPDIEGSMGLFVVMSKTSQLALLPFTAVMPFIRSLPQAQFYPHLNFFTSLGLSQLIVPFGVGFPALLP